ncbi:MAG: serine hydrolase domain-containing protein, partial [Bacteroidota bacterium]
MKQLFTLVLILSLNPVFLGAQSKEGFNLPPADSLSKWQKELGIPALGIATIEQGKINRQIVQGELTPGKAAPYNAIFDVASITKSMLTYLTMQLVSQGQWDLDEPLYPYWVDPDVKDDPRHKKLTSRIVLSHQTGFKNWRFMNEDKKLAFDFEPGTKFGYSGEGFVYLQRALEKKFEQPLEQLLQEQLFDPYSMKDSHLIWTDRVDVSRQALGHNASAEPYEYTKIREASAADDMLTTVGDLARFSQKVLMQADVKPAVFAEMSKTQIEVKEGMGFGLGWVVFPDLPG